MNSVKESLRNAFELLSEEEARQILEFVQRLQQNNGTSLTLRRLASDPAFTVPAQGFRSFRAVEPAPGKGIAASSLLIQDRR